jgi:hypothetical protein
MLLCGVKGELTCSINLTKEAAHQKLISFQNTKLKKKRILKIAAQGKQV